MILSGKNLRKVFDGTVAVDDVSFEIEERSITAIIGPNGAGKTTLFNLITGFLTSDQREIYYQTKMLNGTPPYKIARLGISRTFQDLRLLRQISVLENLLVSYPNQKGELFGHALFSLRVRIEERKNRENALRLLEFVGLKAMADEAAGNLSYGQQKLLSLACCLATGGEILLLDEPVAGVHPDMASQILDLLIKLRDQGKTIVFIEHDIEAVRKVAQRVIVMDDGKIIASGPNDEVLSKAEIVEAYLT
jgi:ABC-type branched-subunit amino acid transport system ATPase component